MHNHTKRIYYNRFRNILRSLPYIDRAVMFFVRKSRVQFFRKLVSKTYQFPEAQSAIILDYEYSISKTYRNPTQVLNIEQAVKYIVEKQLEGAVVETGVFTGGASAYMLRSIMRRTKSAALSFTYWGFDSFEGMPAPTDEDGIHAINWLYGKAKLPRSKTKGELTGHDTNVASYDDCLSYLLNTQYPDDKINLKKGWFQDTIPKNKHKIGPIAILRLDGDFYESTKTVLEELYDQVLSGGIIIIDDYGDFQGCKKAVDEFLSLRGLSIYLYYVDQTTRFFIKPE